MENEKIRLIIDIPKAIYEASQILDVKYEDLVQLPFEVIANGVPLCGRKLDTSEYENGEKKMDRLDGTISDVAYIIDSLILLRNILQTGDCNTCKNRDCGYIPEVGQLVRYNCPFYKAKSVEEEEDDGK